MGISCQNTDRCLCNLDRCKASSILVSKNLQAIISKLLEGDIENVRPYLVQFETSSKIFVNNMYEYIAHNEIDDLLNQLSSHTEGE